MTIYRIQDDLGLPLWVREEEYKRQLTYCDPREVNYGTPGLWEIWENSLWVFQQLKKYSILDRASASVIPHTLSDSPAKQYQYLIQGRHLNYIQLQAKFPLSGYAIRVVDAADEEHYDC